MIRILRERRNVTAANGLAGGDGGPLDTLTAGLGAMLGAGLFAGFAPAAGLAGHWLLLGAGLAAVIALLSAFSTADLAKSDPGAGGGYRHVCENLGRWPGRMAGGVYLVGRLTAAAAIAGCFGDYATPGRPLLGGLVLLVVVVAVDAAGFTLPRLVVRFAVLFVAVVLVVVVAACFAIAPPPPTGVPLPANFPGTDNVGELLPVSGIMFFGFLGFERVTSPTSDQPPATWRRLLVALPLLVGLALVGYLAVGAAALRQLGGARLAISGAPLTDALAAADASALAPLVTLAALVATAGALFAVVGGARRTVDVMAGRGDLPATNTTPGHGRLSLPAAALVGVGSAVALALLSPTEAILAAATCALAYYAFANSAARLLRRGERIWPARSACFGLGLCVVVALAMPATDLAIAVGGMLAGVLLAPLGTVLHSARRYLHHRD